MMTHDQRISGEFIPTCGSPAHLSRRSLLLSAGGLGMTAIATALARASETKTSTRKPKSLIVLWLRGAPSQYETFDPHPGTEFGGEVNAIETTTPGIEISEFLPQTAEQMHRVALLRSVTSKEGDHQRAFYNVQTGWRPDPTIKHPSIGAIVCSQLQGGADIPRHISILPQGSPGRGGYLGARYDAFKIYDPAAKVPDLKPFVGKERFERRVQGLEHLESAFAKGRLKNLDRDRTLHQFATQSALTMMTSEQLDAFEVDRESKALQAQFGDSPFARGCLAAARLIEVGVRCVEVSLPGWDTHADNHNGQKTQCDILDPAYATLLQVLADRELLENTLVVCGGEFGRTPRINALGGRDHWPHGFSMVLAGCGVRQGIVHGSTSPHPKLDVDRPAEHNVENPVTIEDIHATIMTALGIRHDDELETPIGRPLLRSEGTPIKAVLG